MLAKEPYAKYIFSTEKIGCNYFANGHIALTEEQTDAIIDRDSEFENDQAAIEMFPFLASPDCYCWTFDSYGYIDFDMSVDDPVWEFKGSIFQQIPTVDGTFKIVGYDPKTMDISTVEIRK